MNGEKGIWLLDPAARRPTLPGSIRDSPLSRLLRSGDLSGAAPRDLTPIEKINRWLINEGSRHLSLGLFVLAQVLVFGFGMVNYLLKDNLTSARAELGVTYAIARAAAMVLHLDVAMILLPVCRTLISRLRQTPLNGIVPFDRNLSFHRLVAYSLVIFTIVHVVAHWNNFAQIAAKTQQGFKGFMLLNFATGPGWSGYVMLASLIAITITSLPCVRRRKFERFWFTHHLFIIFFAFWSIHGAFCMIKPDFAPFCVGTGVFWQYWMFGGAIYLLERVMREIRGRHETIISKVIQHPNLVMELQIKKQHTRTRAGQYVFVCCPDVSVWQYHPFTLTSAPEEDFVSIHVRVVGDFTRSLARSVGCNYDVAAVQSSDSELVGVAPSEKEGALNPALQRVLPRLYLDGPFGSASEDVFKYEVALLVGAGIGVTPFASILKSIWYRMHYPKMAAPSRLRKVYFFWIIRDFQSFEWFRSLLMAIEAQDQANEIEIHAYLTARVKPDVAYNIMINDAESETDSISGLRAPTSFGRPNWDVVFKAIRKLHAPGEAGVFFCGPPSLGHDLNVKCNMYSGPLFKFVWRKENF